jgi:alkylation response protein AidB-like acyl-CoA dehydrogenase
MFDQGLMGLEVSELHGGSGQTFVSSLIVIEELAKVDPAISVICDIQNTLINTSVRVYGDDAQRSLYLPRLAQNTLGSFCLSEPGSGSDAFALKTRAIADGSDWVINGSKCWISNASDAGLFIVFANADPSKKHRGITAFLVERDNPGLSIGKHEDKLCIRASSTCEVSFVDCRVSGGAVLGGVGNGYKIAIGLLNEGRVGIAAQMLGLAEGAYDYAMPYMMQREQFGQPIASFQGMMFQYAHAAVQIEAAKALVYNTARLKEAGVNIQKEAAMCKYFASHVAEETASRAIDWLGGVGFTKQFGAEKFYRDAKIGKIYEGTSNIQLQTIAKLEQERFK